MTMKEGIHSQGEALPQFTESGLTFFNDKGQLVTSSRIVADVFGKRHADVLRKIEWLECPGDFSQRNFALAEFLDEQGKPRKEYQMTRDGWMVLVMGFNGRSAMAVKLAFIERFNCMEAVIRGGDAFADKINDFTKRALAGKANASDAGRSLSNWRKQKAALVAEEEELAASAQFVLEFLGADPAGGLDE